MLTELGFEHVGNLELNQMLPDEAEDVRGANVFVWRDCGPQLNIDMNRLYVELEKKKIGQEEVVEAGESHKRAPEQARPVELLFH